MTANHAVAADLQESSAALRDQKLFPKDTVLFALAFPKTIRRVPVSQALSPFAMPNRVQRGQGGVKPCLQAPPRAHGFFFPL